MIPSLRQTIYATAKHDLTLINSCKAGIALQEGTVEYWQAVLRNVEEAVKPRKRKAKKRPEAYNWQTRYLAAHEQWFSQKFPLTYKDGHYLPPKTVSADTTNALQGSVVDYLTWCGHFANRTSNEGRVIIKEGKPVRIPSSSKNGMQDIDANLKHPQHPYGIPWKIEIKFGDDVHADHQKDYGKIVQQTGGVYSVVRSMEDLYSQYDQLMVTQKELF